MSRDPIPRIAYFAPTDAEFKDPARRMAASGRIEDGAFAVVTGRLDGRDAVLARTGMGPSRAAEAARRVLDAFTVTEALIAGFAGGAKEGLDTAALVVCENCVMVDTPEAEGLRRDGLPAVASSPALIARAQATGLVSAAGDAFTVPNVICRQADKARLGGALGASVIEMEGYPILALCRERGVPALMVRAVFDPVSDDLPDMSALLDAAGTPRMAAVMGWVAAHPTQAGLLARLGERSKVCRNALNEFVKRYLAS
jgi:adenosylhomocysteine nucleosidase